MVQYEELSENGKKAIEQYRSCLVEWPDISKILDLISGSTHPGFKGEEQLLYYSVVLNVANWQWKDIRAIAESENYWLTDKIKKEENNGSV